MAQFIRVIHQLIKPLTSGRCILCQSVRYLCDSGEDNIPDRVKRRLERKKIKLDDLALSDTWSESDVTSTTAFSSEKQLQTELENSFVDTSKEIEFPSDQSHVRNIVQRQEHEKKIKKNRVNAEPKNASVVLFPGQGSQFVGMGKSLLKYPGVSDLYAEASQYLGYDLLSLCLNGPKEKLDMTLYCQPAVFIASLAALEKLKEEHPGVIPSCVATAGYSIGEYTALVFSEAIDFQTGLELVALRAKTMQEASDAVAGGMMSVYINKETKIRTAMVAAKEYCRSKLQMEEPVCRVANYSCTNIQVIAGHEEALDFLHHFGKEYGIKRAKRLAVSGAFHTDLMKMSPSFNAFKNRILRQDFKSPKFPIYNNVTGKRQIPVGPKVRQTLISQISKPVLWEQTMHNIYKRPEEVPYPTTYEVGPGKQLGIMLKSCNGKAHRKYYSISG